MDQDESRRMEQLAAELEHARPDTARHLTEAMYRELHAIAERHLRRRFGRGACGLTWQPTVLLNETLLRLVKRPRHCDSQGQFFAIATQVMRHVLLDYFRKRYSLKRGGGRIRVEIDPDLHAAAPISGQEDGPDMEAFFNALDGLKAIDTRKAEVASMRILWGLTIPEIAEALSISIATVERDWSFASAWLTRELASDNTGTGRPREV
jgi:RNA polymerase sigma factor (TIGR02999 family)